MNDNHLNKAIDDQKRKTSDFSARDISFVHRESNLQVFLQLFNCPTKSTSSICNRKLDKEDEQTTTEYEQDNSALTREESIL